MNILILCTANQCRSPMAEGILRARAAEIGVPISVSSAGVLPGGSPATDDAIAVCADRGVDIARHVSRRLDRSMIQDADLVLAMTREHLREAVVTEPAAFNRTFTLRELARRISESPSATLDQLSQGRTLDDYVRASDVDDVADPVGQARHVYDDTATHLDALLSRVARWLATSAATDETKAAS